MKVCEITGKVAVIGNNVSHSNQAQIQSEFEDQAFLVRGRGPLDHPQGICRRNQNNQQEGPRSSAPRSCRTQKGLLKLK